MIGMREIPDWPGYHATAEGHIYSAKSRKLLKEFYNDAGYKILMLCKNGKPAPKKVHSLVAAAFHGTRPVELQIRHLNGDRLDNRPENLAYGTGSENSYDAIMHGVHPNARKESCPQGHQYTPENTYSGWGNRRACRICRRARYLARKVSCR